MRRRDAVPVPTTLDAASTPWLGRIRRVVTAPTLSHEEVGASPSSHAASAAHSPRSRVTSSSHSTAHRTDCFCSSSIAWLREWLNPGCIDWITRMWGRFTPSASGSNLPSCVVCWLTITTGQPRVDSCSTSSTLSSSRAFMVLTAKPTKFVGLGVLGADSWTRAQVSFGGCAKRFLALLLPSSNLPHARVAELVDARDSNSRSARSVGSIPTPGT